MLVKMSGLRVLSFNVRGMADRLKRREIFNYLRDQNPDIVCLQETHSNVKIEKIWRNEWGG